MEGDRSVQDQRRHTDSRGMKRVRTGYLDDPNWRADRQKHDERRRSTGTTSYENGIECKILSYGDELVL